MQTNTSVININTSLIVPNKYQPRKLFDEKDLETLALSIKNYGIINPILVRKKDDNYEIIAGERRFRAAKLLGLTEVPVIVKTADEQQMAELALIENLHRQGLTPIEEAKSYEEILKIGNQTQTSLAEKLGKSQSSIANKIRLLSLPQEIQDALANKQISERHARSLISVENKEKQLELLNRIITEKLTVKETERIINEKEITEEEIKNAISDIMKSLNIKEEKEDDNMNNGNFFPNFDNNNVAANNASLNMMNMQSMNQMPMSAEPEMVMPTTAMQEPQLIVPQQPMDMPMAMPSQEVPVMVPPVQDIPLFNPAVDMNTMPQPMESPLPTMDFQAPPVAPAQDFMQPVTLDPMANFQAPQQDMITPTLMVPEAPMINDAPLFSSELSVPQQPMDMPMAMPSQEVPSMVPPVQDVPLFNPSADMNAMPQPMESPVPTMNFGTFEVPVSESVVPETIAAMPVAVDKLSQLTELLNNNGYNYKLFSNDTDNCIIIEFPKN